MRSASAFLLACGLLACALPALAAGPYYARGDFYAGTNGAWNYDAGNQLFDDGLHGDGAANDGVYAADVVSDQPAGVHGFKCANADWSENWPLDYYRPTENARVWTTGPGDVVHFRLDTNVRTGWDPPIGVATDHDAPPGTVFELIGGDAELGAWSGPGVPVTVAGSVLSAEVTLAAGRSHGYRFAAQGDWSLCMFGHDYNMDNIGPEYAPFTFLTSSDGGRLRFEFDRATGQSRCVVLYAPPVTFWARGDFYSGTAGTWGCDAGNRLFDDGLHGDGAAGDGVYGGDVVSDQPAGMHDWKIANEDWGQNWPFDPSQPMTNARLWTAQPGETVHFSLDTNDPGDGWQPGAGAVACDHAIPDGATVIAFAADAGATTWEGRACTFDGTVWHTAFGIANAGPHLWYLYASAPGGESFGLYFNMNGTPAFTFSTPAPSMTVNFEWNPSTGRGRALLYDPTPVRRASWGQLKARYR